MDRFNSSRAASLCLLAVSAFFARPCAAQEALVKSQRFVQTGAAALAPDANSPFYASAFCSVPATLAEPGGTTLTLAFSALDADYEFGQAFASQAAMDNVFPSGTYTISPTGGAPVSISVSGDTYPPTPQVTNGTWNPSGQLVVDPTSANEIDFSAFPGFTDTGAAGEVQLLISAPNGTTVVSTTWTSLQYGAAPTQATLPALTLGSGVAYTGTLIYGTYTSASLVSGSAGSYVGGYICETSFTIYAQAAGGGAAPAAAEQPASVTVAPGSTASFTFSASGSPSYQWYQNGTLLPGATNATLVLVGTNASDIGTYTCVAANGSGTVTSAPATLSLMATSDPGRLINISCRAQVGTGANVLIAGFAIGGAGTSGSESVLVRGSGPALVPLGVAGVLPDPQLQLYLGSSVMATNEGWNGSERIASMAEGVGAFPWGDSASHDSALLQTLSPGAYTAQVSGQSGDSGVGLVEVYDTTPAESYTPANPRIINLSARVQVGTGANVMIAGFVVGGSTARTVLIRASGPALTPLGVAGALGDPQLQLFSGSQLLATNAGWGGSSEISTLASTVGAFPWAHPASKDSALIVTLAPGSYTVQVSGASGDTGVALVEVYEVP